uniref:Uncharacterized protein n=1 Tax=Arundo donax TaxID=35708 RepID=A0A0A9F4M2_ARUDO
MKNVFIIYNYFYLKLMDIISQRLKVLYWRLCRCPNGLIFGIGGSHI